MTKNTTTLHPLVEAVNHDGFVKPIQLAAALGLRPQQVYQYIAKGKLESVLEPLTGKKLVKAESASAYVVARETKAAEKAAKVEAELEGETVDA